MEESKACRGCGEVKPLDHFAVKRKSRAARCKPCLKAWASEYRAKDSDKINENARVSYQADRSKKVASKKAYRARNHERIRAEQREKYAAEYAVNPYKWLASNSRRKSRSKIKMTREDRQLSNAYRKAIAKDFCFYCGIEPEVRNVEHYFALSRGGTDHWFNLVMSCFPCNAAKKARCGTWFLLKTRGISVGH